MSRDQDIITGTKIALALSLDPETGRAGDEQGPLVVFLIVGFVRWRGLAGRDDPLDPHPPSREQLREELLVRLTGKVVEEIDHSCTLVSCPRNSRYIVAIKMGRRLGKRVGGSAYRRLGK
jgi:hypothetical protein